MQGKASGSFLDLVVSDFIDVRSFTALQSDLNQRALLFPCKEIQSPTEGASVVIQSREDPMDLREKG